MTPDECLIVITNLPDAESADRVARRLIDERLAACANILAPCRSVYRWQGAVETAQEVPVLFKTTRANYAALESSLRDAHPYDVPEILAVPASGLPAYLGWVVDETRSTA